MTATPYLNDAMLPWDELPEDRNRYRRIMGTALVVGVLFSVAIPFVEVPVQDRREAAKVPERIARVVERKIELPPPPPPKPKEEEKPKVEEKKPDAPKPAEPVVERPIVSQIKPEAKPEEIQAARAKAQQVLQESGLDALADLRDFAPASPNAGLQIGGSEAAGTSRNMLTSKGGSGSGSGGLAAAGYGGSVSSGFGGGAAGGKGSQGELAKAKTTEVKSDLAAAAPKPATPDAKTKRSNEDIRRTFDQYSARINNAYQRALRDDPTLQGTVSLKLSIAGDGSVSSVSIASSQLNNPDLEGRLLAIVRGMNFGAANVDSWSGTHNLNLFPG